MEQVTRRPGLQPRLAVAVDVAERLAQPGDLNSQHPVCRCRRLVAEQLRDQLVARDDPVSVAEQQPKQRSLPWTAHPYQGTIEPDLERPKNAEHRASAHPIPPLPSVLRWRDAG